YARVFRVAAVMLHAELVADRENGVALRKARVLRFGDRPRQVDAADAGGPQQDAPLARRGERILVVHIGVRDAHGEVAQSEALDVALVDLVMTAILKINKIVGLEGLHDPCSTYSDLIPDCFTAFVQRVVCELISSLNCAGPRRRTSAPSR